MASSLGVLAGEGRDRIGLLIASVLHARVDHWVEAAGPKRQAAADLIPRGQAVTDPDLARALTERDQAMERRARAFTERPSNTTRRACVGSAHRPPIPSRHLAARSGVVAACREPWGIGGLAPVDAHEAAHSIEQLGHQKRARAAARRALAISRHVRKQPDDHIPALESIAVEPKEVER